MVGGVILLQVLALICFMYACLLLDNKPWLLLGAFSGTGVDL